MADIRDFYHLSHSEIGVRRGFLNIYRQDIHLADERPAEKSFPKRSLMSKAWRMQIKFTGRLEKVEIKLAPENLTQTQQASIRRLQRDAATAVQ
jgi:hypothetical protein